MPASTAPWDATLTRPEYLLTLYFLVVAGLTLAAGFVRAMVTRNEVGSRYRAATVARLSIGLVAALSYGFIVVGFLRGYDWVGAQNRPNQEAMFAFAPRFMDWSITAPLLAIELLAVCAISGIAARRTQWVAASAAFLMVFSGFLGAFVFGAGTDKAQLLIWGAIGGSFWVFTTVILVRSVARSSDALTPEAARLLRNAAAVLLGGWVVYPLVYLIPIFGFGGGLTTAIQIALCVADVGVKLGFGGLIHRVAKLRTAEDVRAGEDVHPESIWISSVKQSDAGAAHEVYLAEGSAIHPRRDRPPTSTAVAMAADADAGQPAIDD